MLGARCGEVHAESMCVIWRSRRRDSERRFGRPRSREHLHDAAGRVAVEQRQRPAKHLDALRGCEAHVGCLALPVGHGGRNAVDDDAHAANAEGRTRAEAADRQLQVLRIVLPVEDGQPGHAHQRFGQIHLRPGGANRLRIHT
jgi:hypothetical protein